MYSWGFFKDCSDRFIDLSPNSVDALLKSNNWIRDGIISLVGILPNRIIQPIAEHSEYPVECLAFSHDRKFLGSISHDQTLKLWDLEDLVQGSVQNHSAVADSDSDSDEMDVDDGIQKSSKGTKTKNASKGKNFSNSENFFADL
ncbi:WD repeat-containing protein 55-like [Olea europaea var. sylvestris]|uniref:WD repeat-containing protein 55-like n=1 Tax=Olea europaea var. sylvestris TaxID=158386 RepID=UPI000C1D0243|nr:WD repeat-containing protein 55-like [Olea europaea var. sylvestris]